jgi:MazG family protein
MSAGQDRLFDEQPRAPMDQMARLKQIVDRLRSPGGCPWDLEQTPETLRPFLLEEAHEVAEAILEGDSAHLCEELGDLLMNIHLQARIAEEEAVFSLEDVAEQIADKLIRRHPHVFSDGAAKDSEEVRQNWEKIKQQEKGQANHKLATIRPLPASLPALLKADRVGKMAATVGFDWPDVSGAMAKVVEEFDELKEAVDTGNQQQCYHELGDLLFAVSSVSRKLGLDGEQALLDSLKRFEKRFSQIDKHLKPGQVAELNQLETWYQDGKKLEQSDEELR